MAGTANSHMVDTMQDEKRLIELATSDEVFTKKFFKRHKKIKIPNVTDDMPLVKLLSKAGQKRFWADRRHQIEQQRKRDARTKQIMKEITAKWTEEAASAARLQDYMFTNIAEDAGVTKTEVIKVMSGLQKVRMFVLDFDLYTYIYIYIYVHNMCTCAYAYVHK